MAKKRRRPEPQKVACPICGKVLSKRGMVGHMAWKHEKQYKAPMLPAKPHPVREARRKAALLDEFVWELEQMLKDEPEETKGVLVAYFRDRMVAEAGITLEEAKARLGKPLAKLGLHFKK